VALAARGEDLFPGQQPGQPSGHLYSEQVFPWIRAKVGPADELRRNGGDDRLFVDDAKDGWRGAKESFDKAKELDQDATKDAAAVRRAFDTRDLILARLPYYSQWVARRQAAGTDPNKWSQVAGKVDVEQLWEEAHRLAYRLEPSVARQDQWPISTAPLAAAS